MKMCEQQRWSELSGPLQREEALLPVMEAFESRLPLRLGPGLWLQRNISWSDMEAADGSGPPPPAPCWPLTYLISRHRKAVLGVGLYVRPAGNGNRPKQMSVQMSVSAPRGLPCRPYYIDPGDPGAADELVDSVAAQVAFMRRLSGPAWTHPAWKCATDPAHPKKTGFLLARGLVEEAENGYLPTLRGEEAGLTALFTNDGGKVRRDVRWSPATKRALAFPPETSLIPLQNRGERLEKGLASSGQAAKEAVLQLADMPLEKYLLSGRDITLDDLKKVQGILRLRDGCTFLDAAAALYRRWETLNKTGRARLMPLMIFLTIPTFYASGCRAADEVRESALAGFRKGVFPS